MTGLVLSPERKMNSSTSSSLSEAAASAVTRRVRTAASRT